MSARRLANTHTDIENSLRGSCHWEERRQTSVKVLILLSASVEVVDDAAKQRFRVKEESYKAYIEELLSLRKRRTEFHQAQPWRQWAASERCCHWRSLRRQGARVKGEVFLGPARVLRQEREKTAESVRMQAVVWITEGTSLV